jgi:hypothetical protein
MLRGVEVKVNWVIEVKARMKFASTRRRPTEREMISVIEWV